MDQTIPTRPMYQSDGFVSLPDGQRERIIAYFSMEIGIDPKIPSYAGGLGVLAGDTIKSFADLSVPAVGVTLLYKKGYFRQKLDQNGLQTELPDEWNPSEHLELLPNKVTVPIENRSVGIQAWQYTVVGAGGYTIPIIFLDSDMAENQERDRNLTHYLYGGDQRYRLCQEVILGIGGVRMLRELRGADIQRYHMNEGHSSLLTLELLNEYKRRHEPEYNLEYVRHLCVFTTHTPVPAGMDQFSYELVGSVLGEFISFDLLREIGGKDRLNMTLLALNLSHYENGVAKEHGKVSRRLFPGYKIDSITNGVHSASWTGPEFNTLFNQYMPGWHNDPFSLRYALSIPHREIWAAHGRQKSRLIEFVNTRDGVELDPAQFTIGFARRATAYKRADLIFHDSERLRTIARNAGPFQLIFAGKAHPADNAGKDMIHRIVSIKHLLKDNIRVVYLENYDMALAKLLVCGVDLWLNTPRKPQEASGTSGMKAAHNGIPSLSILDGWWVEGWIEDLTGWAVGQVQDMEIDDNKDALSLYSKLESIIIPRFYEKQEEWINMMCHVIAINASFFNTHRMIQQYVLNAYME